uniref:MFS transporter n=1 Tax=Streptomyces flavofungini TaxID=68200 RepID=UPI0034DFDF7E
AARRPRTAYRELRRVPGFRRLAVLGMVSKLPVGMVGLSLLLLVGGAYSYGTAGLAVGGLALGQGVTAPWRGRLLDRHGPRVVLLRCLAAQLAAMGLLLYAVSRHAATAAVLASAVALGASAPPVAVMMRALWHPVTDGTTLASAMALDAAMTGTALITGPLLAGWLSVSFGTATPFAVIAVLTVCVVAPLLGTPVRTSGAPRAAGPLLGPLASAPLRRLLAANCLFVTAVTAVDVVLPIHAAQHGATAYTGLYLAALSVGSVLGSLALGAAPGLVRRGAGLCVPLCVFAAGTGALALAARVSPLAVLLLCPVAGLAVGCTFGALRAIGGDLAPPGRITETMSWLSSMDTAGGALGATLSAQVAAARGGGTALLAVCGVAVLAAVAGRPGRDRPPIN